MQDLNYFELLELDPDTTDGAVIEKRLQEKQRLWSRQTTEGTPRDARVAARNLKLLDTMRRTLNNPTERTAQAALARQLRDERMRESRSRLTEFLGFAKGRVDDVEMFITRDCARFVRELGKVEVQRLVTAAGVTAAPRQTISAAPRRETLESATARRIRDGLEHLGKKDLYEFLGLSRRCTARSLRDRAEELNRALLRNGRSDDQTAASKELAGQCMAVFDSEEGRIRYNNTLIDETLEATLKDFLPLAGKDGSISAKSFTDLLAIAARQGIAATDAASFIRAFALRKRWPLTEVPTGSASSSPVLPPCGYCGCIPQSENDAFCWNCKRKLRINCPVCSQPMPSAHQHCTACGATLADAEIVEALFAEAKQAAADGLAEQALKLLERCLELWPQWKEALAFQNQLTERRTRQQDVSRRLVELLRERRMVAAQDCLEDAVRECGPVFGRAGDVVSKAVTDANRLFMQGEGFRLEGRLAEAGESYEQVLAMCTDHRGAQDALRLLPTPSPLAFLATPTGPSTVRLTWKPGKPDTPFDYTLVRKADGLPGAPDDGEVLLADAGATLFDDTGACGGVNWHYAVFATRRDLPLAPPSLPAVAGPLFLTPPLTDFTAKGDDERCFLSWTLPVSIAGAVSVDIRRREELLSGSAALSPECPRHEGDPVADVTAADAQNSGSYIDAPLLNGRTYIYTAVAVYPGPERPSARRFSDPVCCRVIPSPRLEPVLDLTATVCAGQAYLRWTPPPCGETALLCVREGLERDPVLQGQTTKESLTPLGRLHLLPTSGIAQLACPPPGHVLVPVTLRGGLALAGQPCPLSPLEEVAQLTASPDKGGMRLLWAWPDGVEEALVVWSPHNDPADPELFEQLVCSRVDYTAHNGCVIAPLPVQKHFVRVFARVPGHEAHGTGTPVVCGMGLVDTIRYRVLRTGFFQKTGTAVELSSDTIKEISGLLLHAREGAVPLTPADGVTLAAVDRIAFTGGKAEIPVPERFQRSRMYVRLFFANPEQAACVRLMPAGTDELRLV